MTPAARIAAAAVVLDRIREGAAAEQVLTSWARQNRYAGSGDRAAIRDHVFDALRCRRSYAALGGAETGRGLMLGHLRRLGEDPDTVFTGEGYAPAPLTEIERVSGVDPGTASDGARLDLPEWLLPELRVSLGEDLPAVAEALRSRAPLGLRVNVAKATQDQADAALRADGIESETHPIAVTARVVTRNARRLRASRAYRDGLVEIQDPASQAVVEALLPLPKGQKVLDYCAGGGGKALALAAATGEEVFAHDANGGRMRDVPNRARRAGATIRRLATAETVALGPWDVVLVDAPCSGSGAWRRQPEAKWTLTELRLSELKAMQSAILDEAAAIVRPGGRLIYATCSLLRAENERQVAAFLGRAEGGWALDLERRVSVLDGADGFYWTHLSRD